MSPSSNIPTSASQMQRFKSQLNDLVARERAHTQATTRSPESPIEAFLQKPQTPKDTNDFMASTRGCSTYPADQLQMMASQLAEARRNGEFPTTKASPMDVDATIEDYQALTRLRQLRGNPMCPAPEAYNHLRIEITRHIRERDALSGEDQTEGAAARRVDTYLQAVQHENRYFAAANKSMPQERRGPNAHKANNNFNGNNAKGNANGSDEKMRSMVEQTIEQGIADATGPLRMNVGKLDAQANTLRRQSDTMSQQIEMQQQTVSALQTMIQPQAFNIQATTQNLAMTHGLANQLSQIATELPQAVNQAVTSALQEHTQASIDGLLEAQRQAIHDIEMRTQRLNELNREAEARENLTRSRTNSTASARDRSRVQSFFQKTFGRTN
ncbi:hypothetical protein CEP54_009090 [Fusarium duplospermum]|uniref:Uncharacterized protein n=1 Tax=Fusarium duplospermum TaxID=1325734 RepID=A0A428PSK0_9HYPO|nr:hypothetical protein CEP54_009090 [Fusarium duplospermum]